MQKITTPTGIVAWQVVGHAAVTEVLGDADRFSSRPGHMAHVMTGMDPDGPVFEGDFSRMDGAGHRRLRRVLVHELTAAKRTQQFHDTLTLLVSDHLGALSGRNGPVDLLAEFAKPVTVAALAGLLDLPRDAWPLLHTSADAVLSTKNDMAETMAAIAPMLQYVYELVRWRRAEPGDDLLSRMIIRADRSDQPFTDIELMAIMGTLFANGYASTAGSLTQCLLTLFEHPDQLDLLRADLSLLPTALEELLRYQGEGTDMLRVVTRDTVLAGTQLRAGDYVVADIGAASFDPHQFARPHDLDLTRRPNAHLTFGYGPHRCAGEQLARLELELVLGTLLSRVPTLRLAVPIEEIDLANDSLMPGPVALPVGWDGILPA